MIAEPATNYVYVPKVLHGVCLALPCDLVLGDVDWGEPTDVEEIAMRARIMARIREPNSRG